tara:strand:+ start:773 stop:1693 length:921 start_codon:yes stop_codon:yes gene_type:complete
MSFRLTILGSNSALPKVDRNPTSQLLDANDRFFLIDCAEATQIQLRRYHIKFQKISHIFISHLHGDHYFGLIGLLTSMHLLNRKKELHLFAHPELKKIIDIQLHASNTELCYALFFHPIDHDYQGPIFEDDDMKVVTFRLDHGIPCHGFLFEEKIPIRKMIAQKIKEYSIPNHMINEIKNGKDFIDSKGQTIQNDEITSKNRDPYTYAFCSDTRYNERILEYINRCTLLYHESTFLHLHKERASDTNHSTAIQAGTIAMKAEVRHLLIGHFSQRYKDHNLLLEEVKTVFPDSSLAIQGSTVRFSDL